MTILAEIPSEGFPLIVLILGVCLFAVGLGFMVYSGDELIYASVGFVAVALMIIFMYQLSQQKHEVIATIEPTASFIEIESQYKVTKHIDDLYWLAPKKEVKKDD